MRENRRNDGAYRVVEAMYHKGFSYDEVADQTGLSSVEVLDIFQKVFAIEESRRYR